MTESDDLAGPLVERPGQADGEESTAPDTDDQHLVGVGADAVPLRDVIRGGGGAGTIGVLFALNTIDELDRAAFAVLGPDIQDSLGLSDSMLGFVAAVGGFMVVLAAIPLGYLADRARRPSIIGVCSLVWALAGVLTGFVAHAWQLVATRALSGAAKANEGPVQKAMLADRYPIEGRSRIFALHNLANPVGIAIGPLAAGLLAGAAAGGDDWRRVFVLVSIPAFLAGVAALLLRDPERGHNERSAVLGTTDAEIGAIGDSEASADDDLLATDLAASFARLRAIRTFSALLAALGVLGFAFVTAPIYVNLILEERFGLDAMGRGIVGSITAAGSVVGIVLAGPTSDRLFRTAPERSTRLIGYAVMLLGITVPVAVSMPHIVGFVIVSTFGSMATAAAFVPATALIAAVTPYQLRSMGLATVGIYLSLVGGVGGALVVGGLSDAFGPAWALAIAVPPSAVIGGLTIVYGARFVRDDMAAVVEDIVEEREEAERASRRSTTPLLQVRNVSVSYGSVRVLFGVDLDVAEGETVALLGTNGAGKSTLLRAISGLSTVDRGAIRLSGRDLTLTSATTRVRLGVVQTPGGKAVFPTLTVRENLVAGTWTLGREKALAMRRVDEALDLFPELASRLDQPAGSMSGGEQQMLALAKSLVLAPRLLLIDELTIGLSPVVAERVLEAVDELRRRGTTMVIVEQSVNLALEIADRAVFMERGRVRFDGSATDLVGRDDLLRSVFFGAEESGTRGHGQRDGGP